MCVDVDGEGGNEGGGVMMMMKRWAVWPHCFLSSLLF